jgi:SAM-dependent methyltransferase
MTADSSLMRESFARQAGAFARSPFQRDPERLKRLIRFLELRPADRILDVVCRNSFHHFQDPLSATRQMADVVRPGGSVAVEDMRAPDDSTQREYHETVERLRDPAHGFGP